MFDSKKSKVAYCQALELSPAQPSQKIIRGVMKLEAIPLDVEDSQSQPLVKISSYHLASHNDSEV